VVWVGNDDYTDVKLAGGSTAAPIWAEFMKRAQKIPQYSNMKGFPAPSGVVEVQLDKITNRLATTACPQTYYVAFIAGTEPKDTCEQAFSDHRGFFSKILGLGSPEVTPPPNTNGPVLVQPGVVVAGQTPAAQATEQPTAERKKKKGFFSRVFGGKGNDQSQKENNGNSPPEKGNKPPPE